MFWLYIPRCITNSKKKEPRRNEKLIQYKHIQMIQDLSKLQFKIYTHKGCKKQCFFQKKIEKSFLFLV